MVNTADFISAGKALFERGLTGLTSGTLSVKEGDKIYITRKGAVLRDLRESDIVETGLEGEAGNASDDLPVHRAIYKETQFGAIIQAYPPNAIALSMNIENKIMPPDSRGQMLLRSIPVVRARTSPAGARIDELSRFLPPIYKSGYAVSVVKELGTFAVAENLSEALELTICAETSCRILAVNKSFAQPERHRPPEMEKRRSALPPSIGVMGRQRQYKRGLGR